MPLVFLLACGLLRGDADDNADPKRSAEMTRITLEQGRFAPFPIGADESWVRTEGTAFTRTFVSGFCGDPSETDAWMAASPSLSSDRLSPGARTTFTSPDGWRVEVARRADGRCVDIEVSWS